MPDEDDKLTAELEFRGVFVVLEEVNRSGSMEAMTEEPT